MKAFSKTGKVSNKDMVKYVIELFMSGAKITETRYTTSERM